jgi:hypothetical protein
MSDDDFVVTNNSGVEASPSTSEAVSAPIASDTAHEHEGTADASPASDLETPETPAQERERGADGKYKKGSIQERIDRATWEKHEATRQRDALAARIAELERVHAPREQAAPAAPTFDPSQGPQLEQYPSYEEYGDARSEWIAERIAERKADAAIQAYIAQQQYEQAVVTHSKRINDFAAKTPDYYAKIDAAWDFPTPPIVRDAMIASHRGPEIAYFMATRPEEAIQIVREIEELSGSSAPKVARRLLESALNASQTASSGPVAGGTHRIVPAPIKPVGSAPVVSDPPILDLPIDDYVDAMNARDAAKRRRAG